MRVSMAVWRVVKEFLAVGKWVRRERPIWGDWAPWPVKTKAMRRGVGREEAVVQAEVEVGGDGIKEGEGEGKGD